MKKIIAATLGLLMMAGLVFAEPAMGAGAGSPLNAAPQHNHHKNKWKKKRAKRIRHKMKHNKKHWGKRKHNRRNR